ncbi:hypothetical protein [Neisseria iguanae]|uniref:Uncharacterized protein n=1 Tax=Neisseria iguanae TaxID=90242 RepID=A0A2P7TWZ9_9NEIS|nr:hypothetical protein [Neisseria iguanae]PSJ79259.1 hypothetical protein C7N83_13285 [Neisseria iguanae]
MAWLPDHPSGMMPIVGSGKIERIKNAVDAMTICFSEEAWINVYFDTPKCGAPNRANADFRTPSPLLLNPGRAMGGVSVANPDNGNPAL